MEATEYLRGLAERGALSDWSYTRLHRVSRVEHIGDPSSWERFKNAARAAFKFPFRLDSLAKMLGLSRWYVYKYKIKQEWRGKRRIPDGSLKGGSILSYWEEDGEYIQIMQPSVGLLIADWLDANPDDPHAVKVRDQMEKIISEYDRNIMVGVVDGRRQANHG